MKIVTLINALLFSLVLLSYFKGIYKVTIDTDAEIFTFRKGYFATIKIMEKVSVAVINLPSSNSRPNHHKNYISSR